MIALDKMDNAELGLYLTAQGVLAEGAPLSVEALGGGVSNIVLRVSAPGHCLVLKQALPELRVEAYWPSRVDRALREAEALRIVAEYLPGGAVPDVRFIDEENFIYGMSCAPAGSRLWKEDLLAGKVDVSVSAAAGRLLAQMHAIQEPAVRQRFIDDEVFWQLRVDPYYNTVAAAHPAVKPVIARAIARMKERKLALVHGDYSPKNMFVLAGESAARVAPQLGHASSENESGQEQKDSRLRGNDRSSDTAFSTVARGLVPRSGPGVGSAEQKDSRLRGNDGLSDTVSSTIARRLVPRSVPGVGGAEQMESRLRGNDGLGDTAFSTVARGLVPRSGPGVGSAEQKDSRLRGNDGGKATADSGSRQNDEAGRPTDGCRTENETDGENPVLLLDFEVVHWGDPAFDLAFCINHLLIKSIVNSHVQEDYFRAAAAFLAGYRKALPEVDWPELGAETRLQLGCLMLARIDGKSPVEYITDEPTKEIVRRVSLFVIHEQPATMAEIYARIVKETND